MPYWHQVVWLIMIYILIMESIGIEMAISNVICAAIMCITIIGIPFAGQFIKIAKLWLMPFGAKVVEEE